MEELKYDIEESLETNLFNCDDLFDEDFILDIDDTEDETSEPTNDNISELDISSLISFDLNSYNEPINLGVDNTTTFIEDDGSDTTDVELKKAVMSLYVFLRNEMQITSTTLRNPELSLKRTADRFVQFIYKTYTSLASNQSMIAYVRWLNDDYKSWNEISIDKMSFEKLNAIKFQIYRAVELNEELSGFKERCRKYFQDEMLMQEEIQRALNSNLTEELIPIYNNISDDIGYMNDRDIMIPLQGINSSNPKLNENFVETIKLSPEVSEIFTVAKKIGQSRDTQILTCECGEVHKTNYISVVTTKANSYIQIRPKKCSCGKYIIFPEGINLMLSHNLQKKAKSVHDNLTKVIGLITRNDMIELKSELESNNSYDLADKLYIGKSIENESIVYCRNELVNGYIEFLRGRASKIDEAVLPIRKIAYKILSNYDINLNYETIVQMIYSELMDVSGKNSISAEIIDNSLRIDDLLVSKMQLEAKRLLLTLDVEKVQIIKSLEAFSKKRIKKISQPVETIKDIVTETIEGKIIEVQNSIDTILDNNNILNLVIYSKNMPLDDIYLSGYGAAIDETFRRNPDYLDDVYRYVLYEKLQSMEFGNFKFIDKVNLSVAEERNLRDDISFLDRLLYKLYTPNAVLILNSDHMNEEISVGLFDNYIPHLKLPVIAEFKTEIQILNSCTTFSDIVKYTFRNLEDGDRFLYESYPKEYSILYLILSTFEKVKWKFTNIYDKLIKLMEIE